MLGGILHFQRLIPSQVNGHHRVVLILLAELHHLWRPAWKRQHQGSAESIRQGHTSSILLNRSWTYSCKGRRAIYFLVLIKNAKNS